MVGGCQLSGVAAVSRNGVIGIDNALPWHLPADLAHFKKVTLGKPILMGRKTFLSIGRPLPGRHNIVLSTQPDFQPAGVTVLPDLPSFEAIASQFEEVMVIGGSAIYALLYPYLDTFYLTMVDMDVDGDAYLSFDIADWDLEDSVARPADAQNAVDMHFKHYTRAR